MRAVAMPAQGQKSWDESLREKAGSSSERVAMPAQGQKSWDTQLAAHAPQIAGRRNACPGAEILGLSRPNVAPTRRRLKSRNACPGAEILGPDQGQCCGCGGQFVTTPAQGQKSWDMYFHSPSVVMRSVTMPAQGQKSWDLGAVGAIAFGRDVAMPAQGQKSWD